MKSEYVIGLMRRWKIEFTGEGTTEELVEQLTSAIQTCQEVDEVLLDDYGVEEEQGYPYYYKIINRHNLSRFWLADFVFHNLLFN